MHPDLFAIGDSVLLVGEGNFSFAVGLMDLDLDINITATCLESDVSLEMGKQNIAYLKKKGARVLLRVDATKLTKHPILRNEKFSKIIFNFPHTGGKMKIHLNRMLLKQFFLSAADCIVANGRILVSLCKGQGGTKFDKPIRRWDDTWQIVEMAAQGNFVLVSVESFRSDLFPSYSSVGYRGGSSAFHTDDALVHVLSKREPFFLNVEFEEILKCLKRNELDTRFGKIKLSFVHNMMYRNNPFKRKGSVINYFIEQLTTSIETYRCNSIKIRLVSDDDIPLYCKISSGGPHCSIENEATDVFLRHTLIEIIDKIFKLYIKNNSEVIMYPGSIFSALGSDFAHPPMSCHILLVGDCPFELIKHYLNMLVNKFRKYKEISVLDEKCRDFHILQPLERFSVQDERNISIKEGDEVVLVAQIFSVIVDDKRNSTSIPVGIIYPEKLSELLFGIKNWRQIWSENSFVSNDYIPVLNLACLDSLVYKLDISFSESPQFSEEKFFDILWNFAADIITKVELLNLYESPQGWKSRCYRITYQSFDRPLCKRKAIEIQEKILSKILQVQLGVTLR